MMKKYFFFLALPIMLYACGKKSDGNDCVSTGGVPTAAEIANLQNFITTNGITATQDPRGFFYQIAGPGYGTSFPNLASNVTVKYRGTFTNGNVFDSTATGATVSFPLSNVILGWQYGVPLVKKDGVINLYLPPSLGYGCSTNQGIPANSILVFNVVVVNY